jgi:hypothetical protein
MFSCKMVACISDFKNVFDLYSQIGIVEACFDLKKSGIYIYTTCNKIIHAMTTFSSSAFQEYSCDKERVYTLNIKSMKENLKNITNVGMIELTIKNEFELIIKMCKKTKTIELEKTVMLKDSQVYGLPPVVFGVEPLNVKSLDFLEFCGSIIGKYETWVRTSGDVPEIIFESEKNKVTIKSNGKSNPFLEPYSDKFKVEQFSNLKKLAKFDSNLKIYANPGKPLVFETNIGCKDNDKILVWIKSLKQLNDDYEEV